MAVGREAVDEPVRQPAYAFDAPTRFRLASHPWRSIPIDRSTAGPRPGPLRRAGYLTYGDLADLRVDVVLRIAGFGLGAFDELRRIVPVRVGLAVPEAERETDARRPERSSSAYVFDHDVRDRLLRPPFRYVRVERATAGSRAALLVRAGFETYADLAALTDDRLVRLRSFGPTALAELVESVEAVLGWTADRLGSVPAAEAVFDADTRRLLARPPWADMPVSRSLVGSRYRSFERAGYLRLGDLADLTVPDLLRLRSIGRTTLEELRARVPTLIRQRGGLAPSAADGHYVLDAETRAQLNAGNWRFSPVNLLPVAAKPQRLVRAGYTELGHLADLTIDEFMRIGGVGPVTAGLLSASVRGMIDSTSGSSGPRYQVSSQRGGEPASTVGLAPEVTNLLPDDLRELASAAPWAEVLISVDSIGTLAAELPRNLRTRLGDLAEMSVESTWKHDHAELLERLAVAIRQLVGPPTGTPDSQRVGELVVSEWLSQLGALPPALAPFHAAIPMSDTAFGIQEWPCKTLDELLQLRVVHAPAVLNRRDRLITGLAELERRVVARTPLIEELRALLPPGRDGEICALRWGWTQGGARTLEEVGSAVSLTRERVRQIVKRAVVRHLSRSMFLPTATLVRGLVRTSHQAISVADLGERCVALGYALEAWEVDGLRALDGIGLMADPPLAWSPDGSIVAATSQLLEDALEADDVALPGEKALKSSLAQSLGRHGVVDLEAIRMSLVECDIDVTLESLAAYALSRPGVTLLGGDRYAWRPDDADSAFHWRLRRLLIAAGPQRITAIQAAFKRDRRRRATHGVQAPFGILREALMSSPFVVATGDRYAWVGPVDDISIGAVERIVLDLVSRYGPVVHIAIIRREAISRGFSIHTVNALIGTSMIVERAAPSLYAVTGSDYLPADLDAATEVARTEVAGPGVTVDSLGWVDGDYRLHVRIPEVALWGGTITVPAEGRLEGGWTLVADKGTWDLIVEHGHLRNGIRPWARRTVPSGPLTFRLDFSHPTRAVTVEHLSDPRD